MVLSDEPLLQEMQKNLRAERRFSVLRGYRRDRTGKPRVIRRDNSVAVIVSEANSAGRSTGNQAMILTDKEIFFLDVYCHEGTERPFGGAATDVMTSIGVDSGDSLNLQWAYLRDKPPAAPIIGNASKVAPPLPWANREAVLRRDAEIATIREEMQRERKVTTSKQRL